MRLNTLVFWYRNHLSWRRTFCSGPEVVQKDTVAFQSREIRPLRSYLYDYLYHRKLGYFSRGPIHYVSDPIPFNVLLGESSYRKALLSEYEKAKGFLTPVEIFKPHYGNAIARYILTKLKEQKLTPSQTTPLHILEIGSGTGTALHNILSYFKEKAPSVFENVHCTSLELSEAQIERQLEVLSQFKHKVTIKATDVLQYKERNEQHGYILSLEVLDNFPHDKIKFVDGRLLETVVDIDYLTATATEHETVRPLTDPLIIEFLTTLCTFYNIDPTCLFSTKENSDCEKLWYLLQYPMPSFDRNATNAPTLLRRHLSRAKKKSFASRLQKFFRRKTLRPETAIYIPTTIFQLFKHLRDHFPNHHLIIADFNYLPDSSSGINAPTVQQTRGTSFVVRNTFWGTRLGEYDIFWPIDFDQLQVLYRAINPTQVLPTKCVVSTREFMLTHAEFLNTRTRLGYNPLLEDFTNTSFFLSQGL